jgi:hypothetical protein
MFAGGLDARGRTTRRSALSIAVLVALVGLLIPVASVSAAPGAIAGKGGWATEHIAVHDVTTSCDGSTLTYSITGEVLTGSVTQPGETTYTETGTATLSGSGDPSQLATRFFGYPASEVVSLSSTWSASFGDVTYSGTRTLAPAQPIGSPIGGPHANVGTCVPVTNASPQEGMGCYTGCNLNAIQRQLNLWSTWEATVTDAGGTHHEFGLSSLNLEYFEGTYTLFDDNCPTCGGVGIPIPGGWRTLYTNFWTATIGTTPAPAFDVFTGAVDMGYVELGQTVYPYTSVYNRGTAPGTISDISVSGPDASGLLEIYDDCLLGPVDVLRQCGHSWSLTPTELGPIDITAVIVSDDSDSPHVLSITGTVITPRGLGVTPASHDFGNVGVGVNSSRAFEVTNTGGGPVNIWSVGLNGGWGEFDVVPISEDCSYSANGPLEVGESCTATVTFTPSSLGAKSGRLYLFTDLSPSDVYADLSGTGVDSVAVGISGTVTSGGSPVGDLIVYACGDPGCLQSTTAADGTYELSPLGAGTYGVGLAKPPNYGIQHVSGPVVVSTGLTTYDIDLPTGGMAGLIRDTEGDVVSANIIVCGTTGNCSSTVSDGSGYELPYLPPDSYSVTLQPMDADHVETLPPDPVVVGAVTVVQDLVIDRVSADDAAGDPGPGGTIETGNGEPTADDVSTTSVTTPTGGQIDISESAGTPPATGYGFVGQSVSISAPDGTVADPLRITFRLDASAVPPGHDETTIEVFRNGVLVQECQAPGSGDAMPDPCIEARSVLGDGDIAITALTTQASLWQLGVVSPYPFAGFFAPVDNAPTVNSVSSGQAIPVKFSLGGDRGLDIFVGAGPYSQRVTCDSSAPLDAIETVVSAGASSISFDAGSGRYQFTWKTQKAWAGTCRTLTLHFVDGTTRTTVFSFKK